MSLQEQSASGTAVRIDSSQCRMAHSVCPERRLLAEGLGPLDPQAGAHGEWRAGIADGGDVLIVGEVFRLGINVQPLQQLEAAAQVQLGVAPVQIAIGQHQRVPLVDVFIAEEG